MNDEKKISPIGADLLLLLVAFIWGSGFIVVKVTLDILPPFYMMFLRFTLASIIAVIIFRKKIKEVTKSDIKAGLIMGFFLSVAFGLQTYGLQFTTVGKQAFLTGTNVVMVPFIFWIINKKLPVKSNVIAAVLTFIGIGLLTLDFKNDIYANTGDYYTLGCAVFYAFHIVVTGQFAKDKDPAIINTLQLIFSAVFFLFATILIEGSTFTLPRAGAFAILYQAIFATWICFSLQTLAQKYTSSTHASIILCLESVIGSILGILILKEIFTPIMVVGCVVIFIGIITAETGWKFLKRQDASKFE